MKFTVAAALATGAHAFGGYTNEHEEAAPVMGATTCEAPGAVSMPVPGLDVFSRVQATCEDVLAGYEQNCCGMNATTTMFSPYLLSGGDIFAHAGSHLSHAEPFSGAKIQALISASECAPALEAHKWQADPRHPEGMFCAAGAFDGLQALPVLADGSMQTLDDGKAYMRTFVNTEITRAPNDPITPTWFVSTSEASGGFGQPDPTEAEKLQFWGAMEFFVDYDRETLEAVNAGQAIKKVYTANKVAFNEEFDASLQAEDIYGIVTSYRMLHNNVQPGMTERYEPDCSADSSARSCGLNGHCGSKLAPKHEWSYTVNGEPAYGATEGVGFEDDVLLIAEEGHPLASWDGNGDAGSITGTVQALDVATGNLYQLPHLSVGVIEMAFSISTGHPDYIAVGIEEYGTTEFNGVDGGSRWNVWIGKKDLTSSNFLDRNGLAPNRGRVYCFVADDGTIDMAEFLEWPLSGFPDYEFTPKTGAMKPIDGMFDGRYSHWFAEHVNTLNATDGTTPVHMSRRGKQEWGATNPDQPNQWAIAETGLGGSTGGRAGGCADRTPDCEIGTDASTVTFLEAHFLDAFAAMDGSITSRDGTVLPQSIPAVVNGVLADMVYHGPYRAGQRGLAAVDSLLWLKGGLVLAAEDSYGPGGFNMGIMYNHTARKSVPIVGAISRNGDILRKMNAAAMAPFGSFSGATNQEMTGFYDASPALSVDVPYTPQEVYDAQDATHVIVNNQMKGSAGPMLEGFYYSAQTHLLRLPHLDWETYPTSPVELGDETNWIEMYGRYRRKLKDESVTKIEDEEDDWHLGHDDLDTTKH